MSQGTRGTTLPIGSSDVVDGEARPSPHGSSYGGSLKPRRNAGSHRRRRGIRWRRVTALLSVVGILGYGLSDNLFTQVRLHHVEVHLSGTRADLKTTAEDLGTAKRALSSFIGAQDTDQTALNQVEGELALAEQRLAQAQQGFNLSKLDLATLGTCISGVQRAIGELQSGQQQAAIAVIAGVASPCESLQGTTPGGPVFPFDFPDPDVIDVAGTYFAYGTNAAGGNIQIIQSSDLVHWTLVGDGLPQLPNWATPGSTWAPAVLQLGNRFLLFYATDDGSTECISVGIASAPQGPFVDRSAQPLICQVALGGSIDPAPYLSASGAPYLTWKSNGGSGRPATIWAEPLSPAGAAMASGSSPVALLQPTQAWEASVVEGPFMWVSGGSYYLFYSGNNWDSSSYAEGVALCKGPLGPCTKPLGGPIFASQSNLSGPGGASVFVDSQGNPWIALHAYLPGAVGYPNARLLFLRRLSFSGGVPKVDPPS